MNRNQIVHPSDELLLYLDGELDSAATESTRRHLDSCWTCRMRASSIQTAILEYARERERSVILEPPSPWKDLSGDLQRVHDELRPPSLLQRIKTGALFRNGRVAIFAVVATAIAAVGWFTLAPEPEPRKSAAESVSPPAPAAVLPSTPAPIHAAHIPDKPVGVHEELAVVAELHRLKADLGEPIDLKRTDDGRLVLTTSGLGAERAQAVRKALAKFADLSVHFLEPRAAVSAGSDRAPVVMTRRPIAFEQELLRYTGGRESLQQLANDVLDESDQITMYAHALTKIDQRFDARRSAMDVEDLALLDKIREDCQGGASQALKSLRSLLEPIFATLGVESTSASRGDLLETALGLDRLLNAAFAGAQSDLVDRQLYSELRARMARIAELLA